MKPMAAYQADTGELDARAQTFSYYNPRFGLGHKTDFWYEWPGSGNVNPMRLEILGAFGLWSGVRD